MLDGPHVPYATRRPASAGERAGYVEAISWLAQRWAFIAVMSFAGATLAYAASLLIPPSFVATTTLFLDSRSIQPLADMPGQGRGGDNNAEVSFVESQARIITSQSVLSRVVATQGLADDPAFGGAASASILDHLRDVLGISPAGPPSVESRRLRALLALADRVTVRRPERTFVMDVSVRAPSADQAASLANAVAQAYSAEQAAAHGIMARRASEALASRLDELRERVQRSEARAQAFKDQHGLVGTRLQLSSEQQLTDANAQLAQARLRKIQSQAHLDDLSRLAGGGDSGADTPEALASPTVSLLRGKQADARRQLDSVLAQFGPRHPAVRDAKDQLAGLNRSLQVELQRIRQAAQLDYQRAATTEKASKGIVDRLSAEAGDTSSALAQWTQLQQEVDINRNLLNTFLSRSRETSEMEQLDTGTARVISTAEPPLRPVWPPRGLVFVVLGAVLGFWIAAARVILERTQVLSLLARSLSPVTGVMAVRHRSEGVSGRR